MYVYVEVVPGCIGAVISDHEPSEKRSLWYMEEEGDFHVTLHAEPNCVFPAPDSVVSPCSTVKPLIDVIVPLIVLLPELGDTTVALKLKLIEADVEPYGRLT